MHRSSRDAPSICAALMPPVRLGHINDRQIEGRENVRPHPVDGEASGQRDGNDRDEDAK